MNGSDFQQSIIKHNTWFEDYQPFVFIFLYFMILVFILFELCDDDQ